MEMARSARKSFLTATPDVLRLPALRWSEDNAGGDDDHHYDANGFGDGPPPEKVD